MGGTVPAALSASRFQAPSVNLYSKAVPGGTVTSAVRSRPVPAIRTASARQGPSWGRLPERKTAPVPAGTRARIVALQQTVR